MRTLLLVLTIASPRFLGVLGKKEPLPRFIIESAVMPPIFGSYNYDPVKQVFEIDHAPENVTVQHDQHDQPQVQQGNQTQISTKMPPQLIRNNPIKGHPRFFRKHVSVTKSVNTVPSLSRSNLINWWTKRKSLNVRNVTKSS